jgi:hypothetical protein
MILIPKALELPLLCNRLYLYPILHKTISITIIIFQRETNGDKEKSFCEKALGRFENWKTFHGVNLKGGLIMSRQHSVILLS